MGRFEWHILRTRPGQEHAALSALPEHVVTYIPSHTARRFNRRMRRWITSTLPIFPGYVFVECPAPNLIALRPLTAFFGFMRNGDRTFAGLTASAIERLRLLEADLANDHPHLKHPYRPGHPVSFDLGDSLVSAVIHSLVGEDRATLDLISQNGIFGQSRLEVPVSTLRASQAA